MNKQKKTTQKTVTHEKKATIIINFKTYKQGKEALQLAKTIEKVDQNIIIGVPAEDLSLITKNTKLETYAEHCDYQLPGRNTGFILPESIKAVGAKGTFLNHSEHRLELGIIEKTIKRCKKLKLKTAVFAADLEQALTIKKMKPTYLIIEPPELVAGKISVSEAQPGLIKTIKLALGYPFIVGAGIKTNHDLITAMNLGASGIALSSAITKAKKPEEILKTLLGR